MEATKTPGNQYTIRQRDIELSGPLFVPEAKIHSGIKAGHSPLRALLYAATEDYKKDIDQRGNARITVKQLLRALKATKPDEAGVRFETLRDMIYAADGEFHPQYNPNNREHDPRYYKAVPGFTLKQAQELINIVALHLKKMNAEMSVPMDRSLGEMSKMLKTVNLYSQILLEVAVPLVCYLKKEPAATNSNITNTGNINLAEEKFGDSR